MAKHPFRFYGAFPTDWYEADAHVVTACFARVPTDDELLALGECYGRFATRGRIGERWSGPILELSVQQGHGGATHLGPITKFLNRAHELVPIVDAVYHQVREAGDEWTRWSEAQGAPTARPVVEQTWRGSPHDPELPPYIRSAAFDAGFAKAANAASAAKVRRLADAAKGPLELRGIPAERYPGPVWSDADFEAFSLAEGPVLRDSHGNDNVGRYRWKRTRPGDYPMSRLSVVCVAIARGDDGEERLAWLDDGERRTSSSPLPPGTNQVRVRPDGREALVVGTWLAVVDLESGSVRRVVLERHAVDAHYLAGEHRVLLQTAGLHVVDVSGEAAVELDAITVKATNVQTACDGRVVVVQLDSGLSGYAFANDRLIRLGSLKKVKLPFAGHRAGQSLFGWPGQPFELVVDPAALEAAEQKKPAAKKKSPTKKPKVEATRVEDPSADLRDAVSLQPLPVEKANPGSIAKTRDGFTLLALKAGKYRRTLELTDPSGEVLDLTDAVSDDLEDNVLGLSIAPGGARVFVRTEGRVLAVDIADERVEVVLEDEAIADVEAATAERAWVADGSAVHVLERAADGWKSLGTAKRAKANYLLAVHGELAIVLTMDPKARKAPKNATRVFSCAGGKVREIAKLDLVSYRAALVDGHWYVQDAGSRIYELSGLPQSR